MARHKKSYDPNQFSLFDYFRAPATPKTEQLEEVIVADLPDASPIEDLGLAASSENKPEPSPPPLPTEEAGQTSQPQEAVKLRELVITDHLFYI